MRSLPVPLDRIKWRWLSWNALIPTFGPTLFSLLVIGMWKTGDPSTELNLTRVADLTPWALCFFALTLIGSSYSDLDRSLKNAYPTIVGWMLAVGAGALLYASVISLLKLKGFDVARAPVYYVTGALWIGAVTVCHWSYVVKSRAAAPAAPAAPAALAARPAGDGGKSSAGAAHV
jgi:hypothetical protein